MTDLLGGYGSLLSADSRARSGISSAAVPVRIAGWQRTWSVHFDENQTALGVIPAPEKTFNAALFEAADISDFDKREEAYHRVQVPRAQIETIFPGDHLPDGVIWIYVPDLPQPPTTHSPVLASYLDVILTGLLDDSVYRNNGMTLCREFLRTTAGWGPILRDRSQPRYPRALSTGAHLAEIDALLDECLPPEATWIDLPISAR